MDYMVELYFFFFCKGLEHLQIWGIFWGPGANPSWIRKDYSYVKQSGQEQVRSIPIIILPCILVYTVETS